MKEDVALSLYVDRSQIPRRMGTSQDGASETPNLVPTPEAELQARPETELRSTMMRAERSTEHQRAPTGQ